MPLETRKKCRKTLNFTVLALLKYEHFFLETFSRLNENSHTFLALSVTLELKKKACTRQLSLSLKTKHVSMVVAIKKSTFVLKLGKCLKQYMDKILYWQEMSPSPQTTKKIVNNL